MNNFFKQLLGSLVQIGINELGKAKNQRNKDQRPNKEICSNQKLAREVNGTLDKEQGKFWAR